MRVLSFGVYRFLLSRQWVLITLIGLLLIPVMIRLGFWQLHRHQSRVAHNHVVSHSLKADPTPIDRLTGVDSEPAEHDQYRAVTASGHYDTRHEVVVRQRTAADGNSIGYFVVTPLIRQDGTAVLVNRGWIAAKGDLTKFPEVPEPPHGHVTVRGRIMADETSAASGIKDKKGLPPRQVMLINSKQQAKSLHRQVLGGNIQLAHTSPKPHGKQPAYVPPPDHSSIGPHMAYAVQWWLFASAVPVGWVVLVRRERHDRLEARKHGSTSGEPEDGQTGGQSGGPDSPPEGGPDSPPDGAPDHDTGGEDAADGSDDRAGAPAQEAASDPLRARARSGGPD